MKKKLVISVIILLVIGLLAGILCNKMPHLFHYIYDSILEEESL